MNYENITLEDFRNLSEDDFKKMPKKIYEKFIEEERKHIFRTPKPEWNVEFVSAFEEGGSNYKVSPLKIGKKVIIFLRKKGEQYEVVREPFATHILEQVFDEKENIVQENLKLKI